MERIKSINRDRILWCCEDNGISTDNLATELDIPQSSMSKVVAGEDGLTFNQLKKIADYFGRGVLFFLEQSPVNIQIAHSPQFRTLANQKPEISTKLRAFIKRAEKQRDIFIGLREDLDPADYPIYAPPEVPRDNPELAARITRDWLGLTNQSTFDEYRAAVEAKGVLVFRSNGYNGKWQIAKESPILGFCLYEPTCPVIVIKKLDKKAEVSQTFTLMHELGHLILHRSSSIDDNDDISFHSRGQEREANLFAGCLLVPDNALHSINDNTRPNDVSLYDDWLRSLRRELGVSGEVIIIRLLNANRISQEQYNTYKQWLNDRPPLQPEDEEGGSRAYRHREPMRVFGDRFVKTVLDSLSTRRISLSKASNYLDTLKIQDLHKLERYYANL